MVSRTCRTVQAILLILGLATIGCGEDISVGPVENGSNAWPQAEAPEGLRGTGWNVGDTAFPGDFTDQYGGTVAVEQFYGSVLVLDFGASWCRPCQFDARVAQASQDRMREAHDFPFWRIQILGDVTREGEQLASAWANTYGLEFPVFAGLGALHYTGLYRVRAFPTFVIVDPEFRIVDRFSGADEARMEESAVKAWETYVSRTAP